MATQDWSQLKVVDLKAELKNRGLATDGLKANLVARLTEDDEANAAGGEAKEEPVAGNGAAEEEPPSVESDIPTEPAIVIKDGAEPKVAGVDEMQEDGKVEAQEPEPEAMITDEAQNTQTEQTAAQETAAEPTQEDSRPSEPAIERTATNPSDEATPEAQKRKRRSATPPPKEEEIAHKKARTEDEEMADAPAPGSPRSRQSRSPSPTRQRSPAPRRSRSRSAGGDRNMDFERDVAPAVHPATSALYINNLMRPIRPEELREHLARIAVPSTSGPAADEVITTFFIDPIRTHALVNFSSISAASRVRTEMHDRVWPQEANRRALSIDFVPPEKVQDWIEVQERGGRSRNGSRFEVKYDTLPDGTVEAFLESGVMNSRPPPPPPQQHENRGGRDRGPGPAQMGSRDDTNSIPLGPRGFRGDVAPPTGPRGNRERPAPFVSDAAQEMTRSRPSIAFQTVSESLAQRRLENMRSFYTQDTRRQFGREINRYFFEDGDSFVDRGKEHFEGIRPPHRERGGGGRGGFGGRGGGRRGGGGGPRRGDRYQPGRGGDRPPPRRFEDEGRLPRYADDF